METAPQKNTPVFGQTEDTRPKKSVPFSPLPPLNWSADEYHHFEKSKDWYWIVATVTLVIIALLIYASNFLLAIVLLIGVTTLLFLSSKEPEIVHFELNDQGVRVHNNFYLYTTLASFNIEEYHDDHDNLIHSRLLIKSKKLFMPLIVIHIEEVTSADVRRYIMRHLKHEEMHESLSQKIMEYLGF